MSDEKEVQETFSAEYVQSLRQEAANWRKQVRDLQKEVTEIKQAGFQSEIKAEFASRGIKADPNWLNIGEGQSIKEAVENFVVEYPHLIEAPGGPQSPRVPSALPPQPNNVNSPGPPAMGSAPLSYEQVKAMQEDPVARKALQDFYWQSVHQAQFSGQDK